MLWCRTTRVAGKTASPGSSAAVRSRHEYGDALSGSVAFSNGPTRMLSGSDYR